MKYFKQNIGRNKATVTYYLQEPSEEINLNQKYPVMVVVPGGAYMWTSDREGEPIALEFVAKGYHAIVVNYDTEGLSAYRDKTEEELPGNPVSVFPNPLVELAEAISFLRENADKWSVDIDNISVIGFSAGANLVGLLGVYWYEEWLENLVGKNKKLYQPNNIVLAYGALDLTGEEGKESYVSLAITGKLKGNREELIKVSPIYHINEKTPPAFIWHTGEDPLVPPSDSLRFALAMEENKRPYELHIYEKGVHGVALADWRTSRKANQSNKQASTWTDLLVGWLNEE